MDLLTRKTGVSGEANAAATLDYDTRLKSRARISLDDGREAALQLPRGSLLRGGDLLSDEAGRLRVQIRAAAEPVSYTLCRDALRLAIACYHLGNRHVPLQIESGRLTWRYDSVLDQMLSGLGFQVVHGQLPFEPVAGAYPTAADGHSHSHSHSAGERA